MHTYIKIIFLSLFTLLYGESHAGEITFIGNKHGSNAPKFSTRSMLPTSTNENLGYERVGSKTSISLKNHHPYIQPGFWDRIEIEINQPMSRTSGRDWYFQPLIDLKGETGAKRFRNCFGAGGCAVYPTSNSRSEISRFGAEYMLFIVPTRITF